MESVAFNADGSQIIVVYDNGRIVAYPIALRDAIENARSRVSRSFTDHECRIYLHAASCPD